MIFTYSLQSIGWADIRLKVVESDLSITASYLSEPLVDLVRSIELLLPACVPVDEVRSMVQFDMDSEPAIHRWTITTLGDGTIGIQIICYEDGIDTLPGERVFNERCDLNDFIRAVVQAMDQLLKTHGFIGYRKQWYAQDFPISSYLRLKHYLLNNRDFPSNTVDTDEWIEKIETSLLDEWKLIEIRM